MKFTTILSAIPLLAGVNALPAQKANNGPFTVMSIRSGSPIMYASLTASGSNFYLGGNTSTYCPPNVKAIGGCGKNSGETVITGQNYLDVTVPGGQQIYVDPTGALRFTTPHSGYTTPGSATTGFSYTPAKNGEIFGSWDFTGLGGSGFMACPGKNGGYQVFAGIANATVPTGNVDDCLGFEATAEAWKGNGTAAWEYI